MEPHPLGHDGKRPRRKLDPEATTASGRHYVNAQDIEREEVPLVPIAHALVFMLVRKEVCGYILDPFGRQNFACADLAK